MTMILCFVAWLLTIAVPTTALAQARPPIKIGLLLPYTGVFTVQGQGVTRGLELYLSKIGFRAAGREIELIKEDSEAKPDVAVTKIKKLVERDRVDFVVGPVSSAVALAIRNYVHDQGVPMIVPTASTRDLTAPKGASPSIFRLIDTTDQACFPMGVWMMKNTKHRKLVVMASDFVAGRQFAGAFMAGYREAGGEIVREIYAPLGTADFAPFITQVGSVKADAVWAWFGGADAIRFVKQYNEYGLADRFPLFGYNIIVEDVVLPAIGEIAIGVIAAGAYSAAIDTPENGAFVRDYEQRYNSRPAVYSETGHTAAQLIAAAAEALKGDLGDKRKVREALRRAVTDIKPARGPIQFDQYNQVITTIYLFKVEKQGGRLINAVIDRIPMVSQETTWKWWLK